MEIIIGIRVAAFGKAAGIAGMSISLKLWGLQKLHPESSQPLRDISPYFSRQELIDDIKETVLKGLEQSKKSSLIVSILGPSGRSGTGARSIIKDLNLPIISVDLWDSHRTDGKGPIPELLDADFNELHFVVSQDTSFSYERIYSSTSTTKTKCCD
eukprot:TRINITY_DN5450_c0_g1_i1.p1 TRINITY_DN5450_c0_g1~~TRINITY_DN5450_c0_g1_i1.p1  ORF type:complete len:156 (-),score=18.48 TRINITY_DN5450_c0_g1_i1:255-722(-)